MVKYNKDKQVNVDEIKKQISNNIKSIIPNFLFLM